MAVRLVPESLFGRLMLALIGAVGITLLVAVLLIVRERRDLALLGTGAWSTAQLIADTSIALAGLPPTEREAAVAKLEAESLSTDDEPRPRPTPRRIDPTSTARAYERRIERDLGKGFGVTVTPSRPRNETIIPVGSDPRRRARPPEMPGPDGRGRFNAGGPDAGAPRGPGPGGEGGPRFAGFLGARFLDVSVQLPDGQTLIFRTPAPQPGPPMPQQIFIELSLLTIVLALVLYFMTRSITRPLSDLARAAETVGRGGRHVPLQERGAREVRNATRAFNSMQERLQRYLDSRTRVLAAMSHDLRTPLTRLRLRAESIDNQDLRNRFTADLDEMNQMVRGALGLFRDLNDDEAVEPVDVDALLRQLQAEFAETGGEILLEGTAGLPVLARPNALKRCLANLLHNAIKYGVRAHVAANDGSAVTIRVRDEGPGIPAEYLEQVFEPFVRVESSRNRDTGGTGLGLCIARDVVQSHGGSVALKNLPEGGLEVTLTLPRSADGTAR
ncbi:MAG: ATP-binding protein [Steroidobacteraceae bacterium]